MATQQQLKGNWNQLKGKIKQRWGQLSDDDLQEFEGNFDQLVGLLQRKTGEARQQIENVLNDLSDQGASTFSQATDTARQYADEATERLRNVANQARERAIEGYEEAYGMIRSRPAESVAIAFGAGLVLGIVVGMVACSRD